MQKWRNLIFSAAMLVAAFGYANDGCSDPRFQSSSSTCFIDDYCLAVDFLWWKPCINELDYATFNTETDSLIKVEYKGLCPKAEAGIRFVLGRPSFYCDWGFVSTYNYFKSTKHASMFQVGQIDCPLVHPAVLGCITELFDGVDAAWKMFYNEWDTVITYDLSGCNPCHLFQPFIGVAGINLKQKLSIDLFQEAHVDTIHWKSDFWGVGLRAGIEYQYMFNDCLRFFSIVHGTMLSGKGSTKNKQNFCQSIELKDDNCCLFVPGYHIGLGLIYEACFCRVNYSVRIGYEFLEWCNLPNERVFVGDEITQQANSTPSTMRRIAFHGWMAGAGIVF